MAGGPDTFPGSDRGQGQAAEWTHPGSAVAPRVWGGATSRGQQWGRLTGERERTVASTLSVLLGVAEVVLAGHTRRGLA